MGDLHDERWRGVACDGHAKRVVRTMILKSPIESQVQKIGFDDIKGSRLGFK